MDHTAWILDYFGNCPNCLPAQSTRGSAWTLPSRHVYWHFLFSVYNHAAPRSKIKALLGLGREVGLASALLTMLLQNSLAVLCNLARLYSGVLLDDK